jgi:hypothetical protein
VSDKIKKLIEAIDHHPYKLHSDYTPSVEGLIKIGKPAMMSVLDLFLTSEEITRLRAQRVLEIITMKMYGFNPGHGWEVVNKESEWKQFWNSLGDLNYKTSIELRSASVRLWKEWLKNSA